MNNFPNEASYRIWKMLEFDAKNNIKSPLGLISLLIMADPQINIELNPIEQKDTMEL